MIVYFNGRFMDREKVCVSPDDRAFTFGDGVYEVVRCYDGRLFRMDLHIQRLHQSLEAIRLSVPDLRDLEEKAERLIHENALDEKDGVIYIQITRGAAPRSHAFPPPETPLTVYMTATESRPVPEKWEKGVSIVLVEDIRWGRCDIKTIARLPNILAGQEAADAGAEEAVFVRNGRVTEGSHTNIAIVKGGEIITHPEGHDILTGVTRHVALRLCRDLEIPVREEPMPLERFREAEEIFLLGSSTEIMPVIRVDGRTVGNGIPGPVTRQLQKGFQKIIRQSFLPPKSNR